MKAFLPFLALAILPCSAFDIPNGFFTAATLQDARTDAAAKPKMVGVLITRPSLEPT